MTDTTAKISLIITSRPAVFRRAGFAFTREAQTISLEKLGAVKARQLLTEPELVCQLELRSADADADADRGIMLSYSPDHIDVIAAYADGDIGDDEFALAISGPPPQEPEPPQEPTPEPEPAPQEKAPEPAPQEKQPAPKPSDKPVKPAKTPAKSPPQTPPRKPSAKAD